MANGLTLQLGHWLADLTPAQLPAGADAMVRRGMVDCQGVLLAGRREPVVAQALTLLTPHAVPGPGRSSLLADEGWAAPGDAAFVNSVAAHALDYDDTGLDGHPSVVLAPVVRALQQAHPDAGRDPVCAYVAGFEVWGELIGRDADKHHGKGWHPTAVFGCVAAAAAAAWMRRLPATQCAHALGLAASMAGGLVANFGSMAKPLQVGLAVRNGMLAAQLASQGVTASDDALENPRGFLAALSPRGRVRLDGPCEAATRWRILEQGVSIKRYPVCYAVHRAVDAALTLAPALQRETVAIAQVRLRLGHLQAAMLRYAQPLRGLDAKFSAQYAIACALQRGRLGLADLTDNAVRDPLLQALMPRIAVATTEDMDPQDPLFSVQDHLEVELADGRVQVAEPVRRAKGHASRPLDTPELQAKFIDCASQTLEPSAAHAWWQRMQQELASA
ncbi:MAG: MmgE/PrpD family protein [Rhodoferax sp.]